MAEPSRRRALLIALVLACLAVAVYWPVGGHPFITLDDEPYVTKNPDVLRGLTPDAVRWAFTTFHEANWHPVTWLSHLADVELFGTDAGWHHRVNLLFHLANTVVLFWILRAMTGAAWRSGFVAALFAVHPLHVESVAWIAERKDLLCALFWLLSMGAYSQYAARGGRARYAAVTVLFLLGLMSKPMIVTLPFVFLLLDYWPLRRIAAPPGHGGPAPPGASATLRGLLIEKIPWFLMSLASSAVTYVAQQRGGSVSSLVEIPLGIRAANAAASYLGYLGKFLWPARLGVFYPHPVELSAGLSWRLVAVAVAVGAAISLAAWRLRRGHPYFIAGWLFFVGTLIPVIGLIQVGMQAMADRYMYLPMIGLSVIVAWGACDLARDVPFRKTALGIAGVLLVAVLSVAASWQVSRWKDSESLFSHTLSVAPENPTALFNLGDALLAKGRIEEGIRRFEEGFRYRPHEPEIRASLARTLAEKGRYAEAAAQYREVLKLRPGDHLALTNLGVTLDRMGRSEDALSCLREAAARKPDFVDAYTNLGGVLLKMGKRSEAIAQLRIALRLNPADPVGNRLMRAAAGVGKR